ncbi:Type IV secretory system Conjugative DNA transfer [Ferrithrix thermotolerans DSM 19514]|uniref:Type IV secretory system Conjugative DNA transfer n=1 Tax=Ferrithrix thermotolerans DSM 19514 TaxID=1121881 RepID=A0A1M4S545_9ACTN|nr:type IV secretory system conjugative DNA transfer family protein [Ferrithrix thermotolerans]SHE27321.1 Type IV secretory system Conjugative DNA transfer [Ferrithrix thermotolerans DSM 19514]
MFFLGNRRSDAVFSDPESHVLVLGPPRSGKTSSLIIPNLIGFQGPAVVTSTKPDVLRAALQDRSRVGTVWLFDPSRSIKVVEGVKEARWSPVEGSDTLDRAVKVADVCVDVALGVATGADRHWSERSKALLAPLLLAASYARAPISDVVGWIDVRALEEPKAILSAHSAYRALQILSSVEQSEERERSAIFSSASGALAMYRYDGALDVGDDFNFDPREFVSSTDTLFIVSPSAIQKVVAPLVVTLIDRIREEAFRSSNEGRTDRVALFLDEMANIAPLPNLGSILSEGASQNMSLMACLQDLSQAEARWPKLSKGLLTLFGTTVLLPGVADVETLRNLSALSGIKVSKEYSFSDQRDRRRSALSRSIRLKESPLLEPHRLAWIAPERAIVCEPKRGLREVELVPYYKSRAALEIERSRTERMR